MHAWQMAKMLYTSERLGLARFVSMQNHYNLVYREEEREMIPLCKEEGIALIPWSPLARGFLAGNRTRKDSVRQVVPRRTILLTRCTTHDSDFAVVDRVGEIATARGITNAQVALAWLMHQPDVTAPIIGASKPHHLDDALAAEHHARRPRDRDVRGSLRAPRHLRPLKPHRPACVPLPHPSRRPARTRA